MTLALAIATPRFIVAAEDSALLRDVAGPSGVVVERDRVKKHHRFQRTFVSAWGELTGNRLALTLAGLPAPALADPSQLAEALRSYLRRDFRPSRSGHGHLGFHVGGLGVGNRPQLFNVSWEPPRTISASQRRGRYGFYNHSPEKRPVLLFNGRHDIAHTPIRTLLTEMSGKRETRFVLTEIGGAIAFADFVVRFAAEITPDVDPPIQLSAFDSSGRVASLARKHIRPLSRNELRHLRRQLSAG